MIVKFLDTIQELGQHRTAIAIAVPLLGGALVVASSILMPRGKAKGLLTGAYMLLASIGATCLVFAAIALFYGATQEQVIPLAVLGITLTAIMGIFTPATIREYQQFEFRKLAAAIFRRS
jgi:hypothetical protein